MELVNEFTVNRPIEEAWPMHHRRRAHRPVPARRAAQEIEGDVYRGHRQGQARRRSRRSSRARPRSSSATTPHHRAVLKAEGRDTGGQGQRRRPASPPARELSPTSTPVRRAPPTSTSPARSPSSAGAIMADVSKKLMDQFAAQPQHDARRRRHGGGEPTPGRPRRWPAADGTTDERRPAGGAAPTGDRLPPAPTVRKIDSAGRRADRPVGVAGPAMLKRILPLIAIGHRSLIFCCAASPPA